MHIFLNPRMQVSMQLAGAFSLNIPINDTWAEHKKKSDMKIQSASHLRFFLSHVPNFLQKISQPFIFKLATCLLEKRRRYEVMRKKSLPEGDQVTLKTDN